MRPYDEKIDRVVPVIIADDSLHIQLKLGEAFATHTSGVERGVILIDDVVTFMKERDIEPDESLCHKLAEAVGAYGMINGFKSHFGDVKFEAWNPGWKRSTDFVVTLDGRTSKMLGAGGWVHPASDPLKDIVDFMSRHRPADIEWKASEGKYAAGEETFDFDHMPSPSHKVPAGPVRLEDYAPPPGIITAARPRDIPVPQDVLVAIMMILGEDNLIIRREDIQAGQRWLSGRKLQSYVQQDPYCIGFKLEE